MVVVLNLVELNLDLDMKKILMAAALLLSVVAMTGCFGKSSENPLIKGVVGQWHLKSSPLINDDTADRIDVYVEFKEDNTFDLYQKDMATPIYYNHYSGTYLITDKIITGKYSDGKSWGAADGYQASINMAGQLTLTNVNLTDDVSVYEKATIPQDVIGGSTRSAAVDETSHRFL